MVFVWKICGLAAVTDSMKKIANWFFRLTFGTALLIIIVTFSVRYWLILPEIRAQTVISSYAVLPESRRAHAFDQALLDQLDAFSRLRSFDYALAQKAGEIQLTALWADRCETRQKDFATFLKTSSRHAAGIVSSRQPPDWTFESSSLNHRVSGMLSAAATGVAYYDAYAYCRAAGGRLPTSQEWHAIASGTENRLYPWGNDHLAAGYPYHSTRRNAAQKCGLYPELDNEDGIHDMGNGVSEWASIHDSDRSLEDMAAIHGGNAYNKPYSLYSLNALYRLAPMHYRSPYVGFRCVYENRPHPLPWKQSPDVVFLSEGMRLIGIPVESKVVPLLLNIPRQRLDVIETLFNHPEHSGDFYISSHEITRRQYLFFLADPLARLHLYANKNEPKGHRYLPKMWDLQSKLDLPANGIDWWSAYAFSKWAGGNLPTARQWISAASNGGSDLYPWGSHFADSKSVSARLHTLTPYPVDVSLGDVTAAGIVGMAGNVSEWTNTIGIESKSFRGVVKGGNFMIPAAEGARADFAAEIPLSLQMPNVGFRLVFEF